MKINGFKTLASRLRLKAIEAQALKLQIEQFADGILNLCIQENILKGTAHSIAILNGKRFLFWRIAYDFSQSENAVAVTELRKATRQEIKAAVDREKQLIEVKE